MRSQYLARACLALVFLLSACSSSEPVTEPSTTDPLPPESTVTASATTESTTTTTTTAPPPTEDPAIATEQAVRDAYDLSNDVWTDCNYDTPDCTESLLATGFEGTALANLWTSVQSRQKDGLAVIPPDNPSHLGYTVVSIELNDVMDIAVLVSCAIDGRRVVDPGAAADGQDIIVDDEIVSVLAETKLALGDDGEWRSSELTTLKTFPGPVGCDL